MEHQALSDVLATHFGWKTSSDIDRVAARLQTALGDKSYARLTSGDITPELLSEIATELAIHESYFFRDPELFDILANLLAQRAEPEKTLRVWSAGSARGEEAYSVAATWRRSHLPGSLWVVGTDISPVAVREAKRGSYSSWSIRGDISRIDGVLHEVDGRMDIDPELQQYVHFQRMNLLDVDETVIAPASWDIVLCRNTLIYFDALALERATRALERAVAPGGYLVTAPTDPTLPVQDTERISISGRIAYRKPTSVERRPRSSPSQAPRPLPPQSTASDRTRSRTPRRPAPPRRSSTDKRSTPAIPRSTDDQSTPSTSVASTSTTNEEFSTLLATGIAELDHGNSQEAISYLRQALCFNLDSVIALRMIALAYLAQGDRQRARANIVSALRKLQESDGEQISGFEGMTKDDILADLERINDAIRTAIDR